MSNSLLQCALIGAALILFSSSVDASNSAEVWGVNVEVQGYRNLGRGSCQDSRGKMYSYLQRTMVRVSVLFILASSTSVFCIFLLTFTYMIFHLRRPPDISGRSDLRAKGVRTIWQFRFVPRLWIQCWQEMYLLVWCGSGSSSTRFGRSTSICGWIRWWWWRCIFHN